MTKTKCYPASAIEDNAVTFTVTAARFREQWVYCRHKERSTWEMSGGHREVGETIEEAAGRELYEETGAVSYKLQQICAYEVDREGALSYGMVYLAWIEEMGELPCGSEMAQVCLFDIPPIELTYPEIHQVVYANIQNWLNLKSGEGELWDIYDKNRNVTGRFSRRGDPMLPGDYHLSVLVWIRNKEGKYLITRRSANKGYPHMWESTGGSALAGDNSLQAAIREAFEETGIRLLPENGKCIMTRSGSDYFHDIWLFEQEFDLSDVVLLEGETCEARLVTLQEIVQMQKDRIFIPMSYMDELVALLNK